MKFQVRDLIATYGGQCAGSPGPQKDKKGQISQARNQGAPLLRGKRREKERRPARSSSCCGSVSKVGGVLQQGRLLPSLKKRSDGGLGSLMKEGKGGRTQFFFLAV